MGISIIIAAHNEEIGLHGLLSKIKDQPLDKDFEIIVVDDGSTDSTYSIAKNSGVKVIRRPYNQGYGAALKTGIIAAKYDVILIMDADGQHNPEDIKKIIEPINRYDMVVGSREKGSYFSLLRKPGKMFLAWIANYLAGHKIADINSGFRAIKKKKIMEFVHILPNTFSFSTTITLAFYKAGYSVKYVPITTLKRKGGKSTVKLGRHGLQTILLIIRAVALFNPLKVFVPASIIVFLIGFLYMVFSLIFIQFHIPTGAVLSMLSGIIIFFFGVLADQIAALRIEKK